MEYHFALLSIAAALVGVTGAIFYVGTQIGKLRETIKELKNK